MKGLERQLNSGELWKNFEPKSYVIGSVFEKQNTGSCEEDGLEEEI